MILIVSVQNMVWLNFKKGTKYQSHIYMFVCAHVPGCLHMVYLCVCAECFFCLLEDSN